MQISMMRRSNDPLKAFLPRWVLRALAVVVITCVVLGAGVASPRAMGLALCIDAAAVLRHTRVLSSDAFEGRAPGTRGEELTVAYLADQFRQMGLEPAGTSGWFQPVPLVGTTSVPGSLALHRGADSVVLRPTTDFVAWSRERVSTTRLCDSDVVFVGYGVQAPEYDWDDFKGVDLAGKTLVVLVGDPPVPDPSDPSRLDSRTFEGPALTYHGRWTCKFERAAACRAAGALIVHETGPAGYPFSVVQGRLAEHFDIAGPNPQPTPVPVEGWLTVESARALFSLAGRDFDRLKAEAVTRAFRPVSLGVRASMTIENTLRSIESRNVIARLAGADPDSAIRDQCVLYTAHWDHLGKGPPIDGDAIRHGAADNAVAVGGLLELARSMAARPERPRRSVLFLCTTAEEQGLLGSEFYVRHPVMPLDRSLAVLNFEIPNVYGPTRDMMIRGQYASDLDDMLRLACAGQGRILCPDPAPEQGWFFRSDHFPFARRGIPSAWAGGGDDYVGRPADYGARMRADYVAHRYHKPADRINVDWDLRGAVEDFEVYLAVGLRVANGERVPRWKPGAGFQRRSP